MKSKHLIAFFIFFTLIITKGGLSRAEEKSEEIKIDAVVVNIDINKGLSPALIAAKPGTTVIWVNNSRVPQEILFLDKKVVLSCGAPVNFYVGKDGAFESAKIPYASAASLCFIEKGKYEYEVRSSQTFYESYSPVKRELKGSIVIE